MKYTLFIVASLLLTSCANTWDSETKDMFHQSCIEEATWAPNADEAKKYCDCVLEKTMAKYPKFEDAMTHVDSLISDPSVQQCKEGIAK